MAAKVIALYTKKGGIGKTHGAINIAAQLAFNGNRVLLIDGDPQRNSTQFLLGNKEEYFDGLNVKADVPTLYTLLSEKINIYNCIIPLEFSAKRRISNLFTKIVCKMDFIPGTIDMDKLDITDTNWLKNSLDRVKGEYDYILIDFPPATNDTTIIYLIACDYIIVPAELGRDSSLSAYSDVMFYYNLVRDSGTNPGLKILGVYYNRVMEYKKDQKESIEELDKLKSDLKIFDSYIRNGYKPTSDAERSHTPLCICCPSDKITDDYRRLVDEICERIKREEQ